MNKVESVCHPAILTFGNIIPPRNPIILVVGREPNSDLKPPSRGLGRYDFREWPRCDLWNQSYDLVAEATGKTRRELKSLCIRKQCSPLAYADASPKPLLDSNKNKLKERQRLTLPELSDHADHVFELIKEHRLDVRLMILSGLRIDPYRHLIEHWRRHCAHLGINSVAVPFFAFNNKRELRDAVTPEIKEQSRIVVDALESQGACLLRD